MWSFNHRRLSITNLTGKNMTFKSSASMSDYSFEEEEVSELFDMPQNNQELYYEAAFNGTGYIPQTHRIINSVYTEQFSSATSGTRFILTSEQPWATSGTQRKLVALNSAEMSTLAMRDGKEMFQLGGDGEWTEVATTGADTGTKYKFEDSSWTSDWKSLTASDGGSFRLPGETDFASWIFPYFYSDNVGIHYSKDTRNLELQTDWMASIYHIHMDYGTQTIQIKQTPDNKIVVRVYSKYAYVILFEDYIRDAAGNPIEFRTGKYTGNSTYNYHGQTLKNGDLYQNLFKIVRVKETNGNGFITRISINGVLGVEVYDPNPLGGENPFSHFLIDNISGVELLASSVINLDGLKATTIAGLETIKNNSYSTTNLTKINTILTEAKNYINGLKDIKSIYEYADIVEDKLSAIWTIQQENAFKSEKQNYLNKFNNIVLSSYDATEQTKISALIAQATTAINNVGESGGYGQLNLIYQEYSGLIAQYQTTAQKAEVQQAKTSAKSYISQWIDNIPDNQYHNEVWIYVVEIQQKYNQQIDSSMEVVEIEALKYAAITEIWGVETLLEAELNQFKKETKAALLSYKKESNYYALEWEIILSIIESGNSLIDEAESEDEVTEVLQAIKIRMDNVAVKGDDNMVPGGEAEPDEPDNDNNENSDTNNSNNSNNSNKNEEQGCNGSTLELASMFVLILLFIVSKRKFKEVK